MKAKFKEKTYETAFLGELWARTNYVFAPDQCDEFSLGFDGAAFLPWDFIPSIFPYVRRRRWHRYIGISATDINNFGRELNDRLPPFKLNLFVQFKRNEYLKYRNAKEWPSWNAAYYRYSIEQRQQTLMHRISDVAGDRAASLYSAAAFHLSKELFDFQHTSSIIENSNIVNASLLNSHKVFTYNSSGNHGIGHSEPEEIHSPPFLETLNLALEREGVSFTQHMKETANTLKEVLLDDESRELLDLARRAILGGDISEFYPRAVGSWIDAILTISAFYMAFDIRTIAIA